MIATKQKSFEDILKILKDHQKIFLVGCGDCATTAKSGGEKEILEAKGKLEKAGKVVTGWVIPDAPCVSAQIKTAFAKNRKAVVDAEAILVFACGSGTQSVKENDRLDKPVYPACDTLFGAVVDGLGNMKEFCSACGECILDLTGGICPVTRCSKGLLNGPCGGMNKGKCEVNTDQDCAWVLIFKELDKKKHLEMFKTIKAPKDYSKCVRPRNMQVIQ
jgi:hypothetical protein